MYFLIHLRSPFNSRFCAMHQPESNRSVRGLEPLCTRMDGRRPQSFVLLSSHHLLRRFLQPPGIHRLTDPDKLGELCLRFLREQDPDPYIVPAPGVQAFYPICKPHLELNMIKRIFPVRQRNWEYSGAETSSGRIIP